MALIRNETNQSLLRLEGDWSVEAAFVEGSHLWALLVLGYIVVLCVGVVGNVFLLAALCGTGSRSRSLPVRNHLMVNLSIADLLVTGFCVPISACAAASHACWPSFMVSLMCKIGPLLQKTPVTASTLSLALLSLDRWAALRHPRFAQRFREKRFVILSMTSIWIVASVVATPTLWARQWEGVPSGSRFNVLQDYLVETDPTRNLSSTWEMEISGVCVEKWGNEALQIAYVATYLGTAFVSPALIVAACHASVSQKLTAQLRVLAGSSVGDRTRRRPKQVIILARDPDPNALPVENSKPSRKIVPCDPNSDEDDVFVQMQIRADLESLREISQLQLGNMHGKNRTRSQLKSYPSLRQNYGRGRQENPSTSRANTISQLPLRAAKHEASIIRSHRRAHKKLLVKQKVLTKQQGPIMPTYSSQSFRSRRRAAKLMAALAAVFVLCWAPYVACAIWDIFSSDKSTVQLVIPFALFIGHAHSAINPVVSWRLNRSAFVRFKRQPLISFLPNWTLVRRATCQSLASIGYNWFSCFTSRDDPKRAPYERNDSDSTRRWQNQDNSVTAIQQNRHKCINRCLCCCCSTKLLHSCRGRSLSVSDDWNRNTSTNEAALGAFHPKYLNRRPIPDPISKCHTSHFLK